MTSFNNVIQGDNFNSLYRTLHEVILSNGIISRPRGMEIYELLNCSIILTNPRNRLLESKVRKHSYTYACGEFFWYLRGTDSVDEIAFYLNRMRDFSDDGKTLNSAYGNRIFGIHKDFSNQWQNVVNNLIKDRDSRQAVITINYSHDLDKPSKDVPCTLNLQFIIRNNKLNMITRMRSNDTYMGLIYDVFSFTLLQEMMYNTLNEIFMKKLELGSYVHNAGSSHMYARDLEGVYAIIDEQTTSVEQSPIDNHMIDKLKTLEIDLRTNRQPLLKKGLNTTYDWIVEKLNKKLDK